jgi:hypothetical protein
MTELKGRLEVSVKSKMNLKMRVLLRKVLRRKLRTRVVLNKTVNEEKKFTASHPQLLTSFPDSHLAVRPCLHLPFEVFIVHFLLLESSSCVFSSCFCLPLHVLFLKLLCNISQQQNPGTCAGMLPSLAFLKLAWHLLYSSKGCTSLA